MDYWHGIDSGTEDEINTIIEIPNGSSNKYELDKATGLLKLDRANYGPTPYPINYGFVPQTLGEDGDAMDVLLFSTFPILPGILVAVRPVGLMKMIDSGEPDDKILAVPVEDKRWDDVKDIGDLNKHSLKEIQNFFETYKALKGKPAAVTINGFEDAGSAKVAFAKSKQAYTEKFGKK